MLSLSKLQLGNLPRQPVDRGKGTECGKPFYEVLPDGSWKGRRCFIIGGGPSLKNFDWPFLRGELTIGVNRAFEKCDPTIIFSMDNRFWNWVETGQLSKEITEQFHKSPGFKVLLSPVRVALPEYIYRLHCIGAKGFPFSMKDGLGGGANSGYGALNLAVCLGANPIYLLGYDMCGDTKGMQAHFHSGYPIQQGAHIYNAKFLPHFNEAASVIKEKGFRVINLNPKSKLKCFEFGRLEDVPPIRRPLVVSYYTKETGYEKEVQNLILSLKKFGLEYDVRGIQNRGSWQANTYYKATFIRVMLDEYPGRDILFLDADSVVQQYPALFDNFEADIGLHFFDWQKYRAGNTRKEASSAVLYVKNNARARELIDLWIGVNSDLKDTNIWEQKNFQTALNSAKEVKVQNLPATYCKIFDIMKSEGPAVIEQFQASRRFKRSVGFMS